MLTLIVLNDQVLNLDEHLYLLLGISRLEKLGQERLRLPIQKPYQINIYIKPEKELVPCNVQSIEEKSS